MSNDQWGPYNPENSGQQGQPQQGENADPSLYGQPTQPQQGAAYGQPDPYAGTQNPYAAQGYPSDPYAAPAYGDPYAQQGAGRPRPHVSFGQAIVLFFKNYVVFHGRASRSEYWWVALFSILVSIVLNAIDSLSGGSFTDHSTIYDILNTVWGLGTLLPSIGIAVRRMHDTNRSGWWLLINLIPLVGTIIFIVFAAQPSNPEAWRRYDDGKLPVEQ